MRVLLPLQNQNSKSQASTNPSSPSTSAPPPSSDSIEVVSEVTDSKESASSLNAGDPQGHQLRKSPGPSSPVSKRAADLHSTSDVASTFASTATQGQESSASVKEEETSKSESPTVGSDRSLKRKVVPEGTTLATVSFLDKKPSAAGTGERKKKQRQRETATSGPCDTDSTVKRNKDSIMVEKKLPSRGFDDQWSHTSYTENNRETEEDPAEVGNEPCFVNVEENTPASASGEYSLFEMALKKRGLEIREQDGDGNCLFRAVSLQIYGDPSSHGEIRRRCLDFMSRDEAHFSQFVTDEPFQDYIERKRQDGVHGNNPEIQAISELFNRPVEVFVPENGAQPLNIFHEEYKTGDAPIRLSYHDGNHYNAVVDPLCPTAGLGLGLPGLEPGLADRMQVAKAVEESDKLADEAELEKAREASHNDQLQRAIKESTASVDLMYKEKAMALSDLEATEIELEQAALVSSLESYKHCELGRKPAWSGSNARGPDHTANPSRVTRNETTSSPSGSSSRESSILETSTYAAAQTHASASVASAADAYDNHDADQPRQQRQQPQDEYPQTVQELVMNGFELSKVVHAYDLIGDNFDELLTFLMSSRR